MARTDLAREFVAALRAGRACLHPTDTLPGLTFDPGSPVGRATVQALKDRYCGKPFLGLVASFNLARRFFAPLPPGWDEALDRLWPGPLSVVWSASPLAPRALVADDGTIGLRVPRLGVEAAWMLAVLEMVELPLPTTSVNRSGEPPLADFAAAANFLTQSGACFVPSWQNETPKSEVAPSSVVRLGADGSYALLRAGAVSADEIDRALGAPLQVH